METPYSCDHTTCLGQTYWRLDTKKNLSMVDIGVYLKMQPSVSEWHQFQKDKPEQHLNPYNWKFNWDGRPCTVGMTDYEKKREEPGAPKRKGADGKQIKSLESAKRGRSTSTPRGTPLPRRQ